MVRMSQLSGLQFHLLRFNCVVKMGSFMILKAKERKCKDQSYTVGEVMYEDAFFGVYFRPFSTLQVNIIPIDGHLDIRAK